MRSWTGNTNLVFIVTPSNNTPMKKLIFAPALFLLMSFSSPQPPAKPATIIISYEFKGIEEGYDHQTKSVVKVDGKDVLTTEVHKQSQPMKCSVEVAPGEHDIRIDTWSMWEGNWELHTVENGYSIDCNYAFHDTYKKKKTYKYHVVYDLDKGTYLGE